MRSALKASTLALYGLFCAGCVTQSTSGTKRLLGVIPVPFTGKPDIDPDSPMALTMAQFEPLIWAAILLMIGGVVIWRLTAGCTGLGKSFIALGLLFLIIAGVIPHIAGWIGLITVLTVLAMVVYFGWMLAHKN